MKRIVGVGLILTSLVVLCFAGVRLFGRSSAGERASRWTTFSMTAFRQAQLNRQAILVDISADWCLPCLEMERSTFEDSRVSAQLNGFATFRIDATDDVSTEAEDFMDKHEVQGVPTLLFFASTGNEIKSLRLNGFEASEAFSKRLRQAQSFDGGGA